MSTYGLPIVRQAHPAPRGDRSQNYLINLRRRCHIGGIRKVRCQRQEAKFRSATSAGADMLEQDAYLLSWQIIEHGQVQSHRRANLRAIFSCLWHGWQISVVHGRFSCIATSSILRRRYCSTNIFLAREMRVAVTVGERPTRAAISWYGMPRITLRTSTSA